MSESETPRTDALAEKWVSRSKSLNNDMTWSDLTTHMKFLVGDFSDLCRQLERDLAQVREEREHDREEFDARDADRVRKWATAEAKQRQRAEAAEQFISRLTSELEAARKALKDANLIDNMNGRLIPE